MGFVDREDTLAFLTELSIVVAEDGEQATIDCKESLAALLSS